MTHLEAVKELDRLGRLSTATPTDIQSIFKIYRILFGERIHLCSNCSGSVRNANETLKEYFKHNRSKLLKTPEKLLQRHIK